MLNKRDGLMTCPDCKGDGINREPVLKKYYSAQALVKGKVEYIACRTCNGVGYIDWIENVTGVRRLVVTDSNPSKHTMIARMEPDDIRFYASWVVDNFDYDPYRQEAELNEFISYFFEFGTLRGTDFLCDIWGNIHERQFDMEENPEYYS